MTSEEPKSSTGSPKAFSDETSRGLSLLTVCVRKQEVEPHASYLMTAKPKIIEKHR